MKGLACVFTILLVLDCSIASVIKGTIVGAKSTNLAHAVQNAQAQAASNGLGSSLQSGKRSKHAKRSASSAKSYENVNSGSAAKAQQSANERKYAKSANFANSGQQSAEEKIKAHLAVAANSREMIKTAQAVLAKLAPGAPPGPSKYSKDCIWKGLLKKHEERWVSDKCNSHCLCEDAKITCYKRKCSDNYKQPKPTDYLEKDKKKKEAARKKREEEERKKEEERRKKEDKDQERKHPDKTYPPPSKKPNKTPYPRTPVHNHFHHDDLDPGHNDPTYLDNSYHGGSAYSGPPSINRNSFFHVPNSDNFFNSDHFRDNFASIFRPIFGSGLRNDLYGRSSGRYGTKYHGLQTSGGHIGSGSGYAGSRSGSRSSKYQSGNGRQYGTEYGKESKYDRSYHEEDNYGTGYSSYGGTGYYQQGGGSSSSHGHHSHINDGSGSYSSGHK